MLVDGRTGQASHTTADGEDSTTVLRPDPASISIVVPAYNEEEVIAETYLRLTSVMQGLSLPYELIFVNDGSRDQTFDKLTVLARADRNVKVINFSRNFGHQVAVTAGIEYAAGEVVVLIDADLQDPPELIATFVEKWREGFDVVYAVRRQRAGETWFKRMTARAFYRVMRDLTDIEIPLDTGDFRLMNRNVVDMLVAMKEKHRFIRGMVSWVGFRQIGVPYDRAERLAGESKYPLRKMIKFSIDGITSFSFKPLQLASQLGFLCSGLGFLAILGIVYLRLFTVQTIQGWASIMVVSLFLGGIQLFVLGIIGEYVGRVYDEVRGRPLYIVADTQNFDDTKTPGEPAPNR